MKKNNNLDNKIPDASRFIQTNLYNTGKQHLNKKFGELENKTSDVSGLVTTAVYNTKLSEV